MLTTLGGTAASPTVIGTYHGLPSTSLVLDVYRTGSGYRGETVASVTLATDADGNASFEVPLNIDLRDGGLIQAHVSLLDSDGSGRGITSETSNRLTIGTGRIAGLIGDGTTAVAPGRTAYLDRNDNGQLDAGERRFVTHQDGYWFDNLAPGRYVVRQVVPAGTQQALPADTDPDVQEAVIIDLAAGGVARANFATAPQADAPPTTGPLTGNRFTVMYGESLTLRALASPGGAPLEAVRFYRESNGTLGLQRGDGGDALIGQLPPLPETAWNEYVLNWRVGDIPGGLHTLYVQAADSAGRVSEAAKASFFHRTDTARFSGRIYHDDNGNGVRESNETLPVAAATVYLDRNNNDRFDAGDSTQATVDGRYNFGDLTAGAYGVGILSVTGQFAQTSPAANALQKASLATGQALDNVEFLVAAHPLAVVATPNTELTIAEGSADGATVQVTLNRRPWANVVVNVNRLAGGDADLSSSVASVTFTPDNWNAPQSVTIRAAHDADDLAGTATFRFSSKDVPTPLDVRATEVDDEVVVPLPLPAIAYQAERATLGGGTVANNRNLGFIGTGYADFLGAGSFAEFTDTRSAATTVTLALRYANGATTDRPFNVLVNGANVGTFLGTPTGGGNVWATASINAVLAAGTNTIRLVAVGTGADADQLTITPVTTPPTDGPVTLQGESAALSGGTVANAMNPGYVAGGYADFAGAGSAAQFTVTRAAAGSATLGIRYANGSTANRPFNVFVNGVNVGQFPCTPTGGGSSWRTVSLATSVALAAGPNAIRLVAVGAGADLDQLTVTPTTTTPPPPPPPPGDPATLTLQGEAALLGGGTAAKAGNGGYAGSGYADFGGAGSWAQFTVTRAAAGNAALGIRYANGSTANRPFNVFVNGVNVGQLACPPTGSGSTWRTLSLATDVSLAVGDNVIRFVAVGAGADLDQLTITTA